MDIKVEALEDSKIKVTVTVEAKDVDAAVKKTYRDFAQKYNFPGFRKGRAPRPVIDNALGAEAVMATVTEDVINKAYPQVVETEKLFPVGSPEFGDAGMVEAGKPFTFDFTLSVKPEVELTSYEPLSIELPVAGVSDAELEEQITALCEHYVTYEDASAATKMKPENYADLAIKATDADGADIAAISTESRLYGPATGMLSEAFDAEIMGMKKGQTKEFSLEVAEDEASVLLSAQAGKTVSFEVTMNVVKKKATPELTDEWARDTMGFEDAADLKARVSESIEAQKADLMPRMKENACVSELIKRFEGEVPEALAEEAEANLLQDFFTQLQRQNVSFDAYLAQQGMNAEQFKADVKLQAADEAKQQLALDAWARAKGIEATDEDVTAEFAKAGLDNPAQVEKEWRETGRLYLIREGIVRAKAMADVMDTAQVTEVDYAAQAQAEKKAKKAAKKKAKKDEAAEAEAPAEAPADAEAAEAAEAADVE
ncbi:MULTISPECIES: trigger factor [unclassified Adlercreutzia]|uniref:trigger factor n=1 Tax=unclassified Adlercreutzia TaxID=2636013 RepID=UPI001F149911|nr:MULTISPECIES: trigger factor [unclassified Adlercreutzia]